MNATPLNDTILANVAEWRPLAVLSLLITVCALTFNGALLIVFAKDKKLRTPFNVYLINLLLTNFIYFIFDGPLDLVQNLYPIWWLGRPSCTVYMYAWVVVSLVQFTTHPLIAVNRTCALWIPIFYRRMHSAKFSVCMCAVAWAAAHLIALPGMIMDDVYYRLPEDANGCTMNTAVPAQGDWLLVVQFVSAAGELCVLISFPLIWYKERTRKKVGVDTEMVKAQMTTNSVLDESTRKDVKLSQPASANPSAPPSKVKPRSHAFLLLAVLTGSVLVFWSPSVFYFSIQPFNGMSHPTFEKASLVLFNAQSVVDPVVFALTLKPLRTALISTFCCYK